MNINDEIQERLNKGESLDSIATDLTNALNKAVAEQKTKNTRHANLVKASEYLRKGVLMIVKSEFPEDYAEVSEAVTAEDIAKALDEGLEELRTLHDLSKAFEIPSKSKGSKNADSVIADFLAKNHL